MSPYPNAHTSCRHRPSGRDRAWWRMARHSWTSRWRLARRAGEPRRGQTASVGKTIWRGLQAGRWRMTVDSDLGQSSRVPSITFERVLPGPIARVWDHLTDTKLLPQWFGNA